jgi:hypothetical protein
VQIPDHWLGGSVFPGGMSIFGQRLYDKAETFYVSALALIK